MMKRMFPLRTSARWTALAVVFIAALLLYPAVAAAATKFWKNSVGSSNWNNAANWSNVSAAGGDNGGVPAINDIVNLAPTDGAARTITYDLASAPFNLGALTIDLTGAGANRTTLSQSANTLTGIGFLLGSSGRAIWNHSGGAVVMNDPSLDSIVGHLATGNGIYNLSGTGNFSVARDLYVGNLGVGAFNHSGGTSNIAAALRLGHQAGAFGSYTINNSASLTATDAVVANLGTAALNISGQASVFLNNSLTIGALGGVNLNGGSLRFDSSSGLNRLTYTAGTIQLAGNRTYSGDAAINDLFGNNIPAGKTLVVEGQALINTTVNVNGGRLTSLFQVRVGDPSPGSIAVTNGGSVVAPTGIIGFIGSGNSVTVSGTGSLWSNETLFIGIGGASGTLTISPGGTVFVGAQLLRSPSATINLVGGTLHFDADAVAPAGSNGVFDFQSGTIRLGGDRNLASDALAVEFFGAAPTIAAGKTLAVDGVATLPTGTTATLSGGTLSAGTLLMLPGSRLASTQASTASGAILALAGSVLDAAAGNLTLGNAAAVNGFGMQGTLQTGANTVTLLDANDAVFDSLSLTTLGAGASPGTLSAANGLTLDFGGNFTGFGAVTTPNNVANPLINNGHIAGNSAAQRITIPGYVKGVGTFDNVNFTGTFSPGLSPTISIVGSIAFSPTSTLLMEFGSTAPGSGYDQLQSSGTIAFDGTLVVSLINGFSPSQGQSFNLFDWVSTSGTFDDLQLPTLGSGLAWNTTQLYTAGILSVAAAAGVPGDYNNNGTVDAADYVLWRNGGPLANDSTPGVQPGDYDVWKANFGKVPGSGSNLSATGSASAAVPEPRALVLFLIGILTVISRQRAAVC